MSNIKYEEKNSLKSIQTLCDESTETSELNNNTKIYSKKQITFNENFKPNLRNNYYFKLFSKNLLFSKIKKPKNSTVIIFDWDDTLLCTSFLLNNKCNYDDILKDPFNIEQISKLEKKVYQILYLSIQKGETYIITNAERQWINYTSKLFFPSILDLLYNIKIISARDENILYYPNDKRLWKINSFNKVLMEYDFQKIINIISIGDSFYEVEASKNLHHFFTNDVIKTVKFQKVIKIEELIFQLDLVINNFNLIVDSVKNYTINVCKKNNNKINEKKKKMEKN
jgi:hypothetical protein